jgi:hypothetical protein
MQSAPRTHDESRPKRYLLHAKTAGNVALVGVAVPLFFIALPFIFAYSTIKHSTIHQINRGKTAIQEYKWRRFLRKHQLPPSQPLVNTTTNNSLPMRNVGFLHLPIEIRLEIYRLVLPPKSVFQPGQKLNANTMYSRYGPLPSRWKASQYIRSDEDPPSTALQALLSDEGSSFRRDEFTPIRTGQRRGRSTECHPPRLILTSEEPKLFLDHDIWERRHYTNLMRTCRFIYEEVLDLLYGNNTISIFGSESVPFFARNASPEGLLRIRYAHLAISIQSLGWNMPKNKQSVLDAVQCINTSMASLRQLDIEVVLTHGQPSEPQQFWTWLIKVLSCLRGLDRFVLKVSVLRPEHYEVDELEIEEHHNRILAGDGYLRRLQRRTRLVTWNESEYDMLKNEVTRAKLV